MKQKIYSLNIPLAELTRRVVSSGNISAKGIFLLPVYYLKLMIVIPAAFLQYIFYSGRIKKTAITKPPVFIIGHYRSGTTYLHKLLAADKQFGFLSYYDMICPNSSLLFGDTLKNILQFFINKLKTKTSFFNNTIPMLDEPAEEERFLINKGSAFADYWRFVFPLKQNTWQHNLLQHEAYYQRWKREYIWLLKLITYKNKGKQIILKSPPNTERIKYLLDIFPGAKFIYISRNPYDVFYSTVNLWRRAIQKFCLQQVSSKQREEIVFSHYTYLINQYEKKRHLIPAGNLVEVTYEELELTPLAVLKKIYHHLDIDDFDAGRNNFIKQQYKEKQYRKFSYIYDEITLQRIDKRWANYINAWKNKAEHNPVNKPAHSEA